MDIGKCSRCGEGLLIGADDTAYLEDGTPIHEWCHEDLVREDAHWTKEEIGVEAAREEGKL